VRDDRVMVPGKAACPRESRPGHPEKLGAVWRGLLMLLVQGNLLMCAKKVFCSLHPGTIKDVFDIHYPFQT
jgi:hypothetical protein